MVCARSVIAAEVSFAVRTEAELEALGKGMVTACHVLNAPARN